MGYSIAYNEDSINQDALVVAKLITTRPEYTREFLFDIYVTKLINVLSKDDQYYPCRIVSVDITGEELKINFVIDGIGYSKSYRSQSHFFTEIALYEFFEHIREHDIEHKFEYCEMYGFRVRNSKLSVYEFMEKTFDCLYGDFRKTGNFIEPLLRHCEPIMSVSRLVSENMHVSHECFLIFFDEYVRSDYRFVTDIIVRRMI